MSNDPTGRLTVTSNDVATAASSGSLAVTVTVATPAATARIVSVSAPTEAVAIPGLDEVAV